MNNEELLFQVPFRLIVCNLLPRITVCALCGPVPSLPELELLLQRNFKQVYSFRFPQLTDNWLKNHVLEWNKHFRYTVELGYNDHGYNELTVITNKIKLLVWFIIIYQWNFMVITYKNNPNHGYNEQKYEIQTFFLVFIEII
jgi:hypothetical protein